MNKFTTLGKGETYALLANIAKEKLAVKTYYKFTMTKGEKVKEYYGFVEPEDMKKVITRFYDMLKDTPLLLGDKLFYVPIEVVTTCSYYKHFARLVNEAVRSPINKNALDSAMKKLP